MENTVTTVVEKTGGGWQYKILVDGVIWAGAFVTGVKWAEKRARAQAEFMYDKVVAAVAAKAVR